jgi:hypothetical protein
MTSATTGQRDGTGWQRRQRQQEQDQRQIGQNQLPAAEAESGRKLADSAASDKDARGAAVAEIAAAQALFRRVKDGPTLAEWLANQPNDPRATLTVFVRHKPGGEVGAWETAQALAVEAGTSGVAVRTIVTAGQADEVYASLAYDSVIAAAPGTEDNQS